MDLKTYRVCRQCGEEWNVAAADKGGKVYLCPVCRGEPWYASKPWLSTGRPPRGGEGHRRKALDLREAKGGAENHRAAVPETADAGLGPAQREAGKERDHPGDQ